MCQRVGTLGRLGGVRVSSQPEYGPVTARPPETPVPVYLSSPPDGILNLWPARGPRRTLLSPLSPTLLVHGIMFLHNCVTDPV